MLDNLILVIYYGFIHVMPVYVLAKVNNFFFSILQLTQLVDTLIQTEAIGLKNKNEKSPKRKKI